MPNPFIYGRALSAPEFLGRQPELRRITSRLLNGQSIAVIGGPNTGKTSLLNFVYDANRYIAGYETSSRRFFFVFMDAHVLRSVKMQSGFWVMALRSLIDYLKNSPNKHSEALITAYNVAHQNSFGTFVLEQFLIVLHNSNLRLVLIIDEFDDFFSNPVFNKAEFYGGLRSLASRTNALSLVIASRRELQYLNDGTKTLNPLGSPYFNIFTELRLNMLSKQDFQQLLKKAKHFFNRKDTAFIETVSGRHPYLAQSAASLLWEVREDGKKGIDSYNAAGGELYRESKKHFNDTWNSWTDEIRKVVAIVALSHIPSLLGDTLPSNDLAHNLDDFLPEIEMLREIGVLSEGRREKWEIAQGALLWWLADELCRGIRNESNFTAWFKEQKLLKNQRQKNLGNTVSNILSTTGKGIAILIEAISKGVGEGMGKALVNGSKP